MMKYGWIVLCLLCVGCGIQQHQQDSIALAEAVVQQDRDRIDALLAKGANPHFRNKEHLSAFATAGQNNDPVILKYFIDRGARPEVDPIAYLLTSSPIVIALLEQHWSEEKKEYLPEKALPKMPSGSLEEKLAFAVRWARDHEVKNYLMLGADLKNTTVEGQPVLKFAKTQLEKAEAVGITTDAYANIVTHLEAALQETNEG